MPWFQRYGIKATQDEHDAIASVIESTYFRCACGERDISLIELEADDILEWLKFKKPMYHMGLLGCCEKLRCRHCDNFPDHCECLPGAYEPWGDEA